MLAIMNTILPNKVMISAGIVLCFIYLVYTENDTDFFREFSDIYNDVLKRLRDMDRLTSTARTEITRHKRTSTVAPCYPLAKHRHSFDHIIHGMQEMTFCAFVYRNHTAAK